MMKNFHHMAKVLGGVPPQSVSNTTVNGTTIVRPWEQFRFLAILIVGGAFAASSTGRARVAGRKISDGNWEYLKESDGQTVLEFTQASLDDGGAGENANLLGTLDLNRIDSTVYDAIRIDLTAEDANALLFGAVCLGIDPLDWPSGQDDDLFYKQTPFSAAS